MLSGIEKKEFTEVNVKLKSERKQNYIIRHIIYYIYFFNLATNISFIYKLSFKTNTSPILNAQLFFNYYRTSFGKFLLKCVSFTTLHTCTCTLCTYTTSTQYNKCVYLYFLLIDDWLLVAEHLTENISVIFKLNHHGK